VASIDAEPCSPPSVTSAAPSSVADAIRRGVGREHDFVMMQPVLVLSFGCECDHERTRFAANARRLRARRRDLARRL